MEHFEGQLRTFLHNRDVSSTRPEAQRSGDQNDHMDGMSLRWIGLMFAMLASGAQFSGIAKKDRDLLSQVYGKVRLPRRKERYY